MSAIFHIGYPKSASTWLQENFFPKIKNIDFIGTHTTNTHFFQSDVFGYEPNSVRDVFLTENTLLFSSELITTSINLGWHHGAYSKTQADKIKLTYPDAKIIIIIRNQQSLIPSAYQQFVKNGGVESFDTYLNSNKYFQFEHLLFHHLIAYYEKLFRLENVYVYMYEDFLRSPKQFIERLISDLEFDIESDEIDYSRVNRGLRLGIIPILRFFNLFHRRPRLKTHYLLHIKGMFRFIKGLIMPLNRYKIFGRYTQPNDFLKQKDLNKIRNFYMVGNNTLTRRLTSQAMKENGYFL